MFAKSHGEQVAEEERGESQQVMNKSSESLSNLWTSLVPLHFFFKLSGQGGVGEWFFFLKKTHIILV